MADVLVLDRVVQDFMPDYSVYGTTTCIECQEMVYVGHATARVLADEEKNVYPICMECAKRLIPRDSTPSTHVEDGACPNCGGKHLP